MTFVIHSMTVCLPLRNKSKVTTGLQDRHD